MRACEHHKCCLYLYLSRCVRVYTGCGLNHSNHRHSVMGGSAKRKLYSYSLCLYELHVSAEVRKRNQSQSLSFVFTDAFSVWQSAKSVIITLEIVPHLP